mmetsp:Transcript_75396/g.140642  ORF Transcript_75396/g.140642 Transcript_75396/m.140642 type:complete len:182 (+) Transcript_75396:122-667(+)
MTTRVWVGGAKSTTPVSVLEQTFSKFGNVVKVETGFPGFAFVEYDNLGDAEAAVKELHEKIIPSIGKLGCQVATLRGYEDACRKRDEFRKGTYQSNNRHKGGRQDSRSPSHRRNDRRPPPRRRRSFSRRRSQSRRQSPRRSPTPHRGGRRPSPGRGARGDRTRNRSRDSRSRSRHSGDRRR